MRRLTLWLAVSALLAGCGVSKQIVAEKDAALEACRSEQAACAGKTSQLQADLDACARARARAETDLDTCSKARAQAESDLKTATGDLTACRQESAAIRQEAEAARREAAELKERETDLRSRLQKELADKTVEIENLRGKLSVRVLDKILFDSGSAQILPDGEKVLAKLGGALKSSPEMIRVEGHTDDVPIGPGLKDKYFSNWELSAARASSVVRYFQFAQEIQPERMEAVGLSMYRPVAPNDTPEGRQRNRRVEIVLTAAPR